MTDGNDREPAASSYYVPLGDGRYQPTIHVQGAWNDHEQHMGPVSGLIAHAIDQHEPRPEMPSRGSATRSSASSPPSSRR